MTTNKWAKAFKNSDDDEGFPSEKILREISTIMLMMGKNNAGAPTRLSKAVTAVSLSLSFFTVTKTFYDFIKKVSSDGKFTIKVSEQDLLFRIAEQWLMDALPDDKKLSIFATTSPSKGTEEVPSEHIEGRPEVKVSTSYDGSIEQAVEIAGHTVKVSTNKPEEDARTGSGNGNERKSRYSDRIIIFTCASAKARDAVLAELQKQAKALRQLQPGFFTSRWGGFDHVSDVPARAKESVALKEGQMDRIMGHLKRFRDNEQAYKDIGLPFRTGLLLHGPPGSGKTSTAAVIANEMHMNLYYISLKGMDDDTLISCAGRIPANSLVILEDVDIFKAVKEADRETSEESSGVSLSAMLNILDGFQSPPGVVFILTTNNIDALAPAIIRPGRVDLCEELGYLDDYQLRELLRHFTGSVPEDLPSITEADQIKSADIVGVLRTHIPELNNAGDDIVSFVAQKKLLTVQPV